MVLAEFEMAHVWLFFVGLWYILNTVIFVMTLEWVKHGWDQCDAMHTIDVQTRYLLNKHTANKERNHAADWDWDRNHRRSSCMYQLFGSGHGSFSFAEFKVLKLYFIQQHWTALKNELGEKKVYQFDYAQYMRTVVTEEIVELLEVRPLTWGVFVVFLWILYLVWNLAGFKYNNGMAMVSITMAWVLFFVVWLLVIESHRAMQRLHATVPECFGLDAETCPCLEDTFEKLSEKWMFHGGENASKNDGPEKGGQTHRRKSTFGRTLTEMLDGHKKEDAAIEMVAVKIEDEDEDENKDDAKEQETEANEEKSSATGNSSPQRSPRRKKHAKRTSKATKLLKSLSTKKMLSFVKAEGHHLASLSSISRKWCVGDCPFIYFSTVTDKFIFSPIHLSV